MIKYMQKSFFIIIIILALIIIIERIPVKKAIIIEDLKEFNNKTSQYEMIVCTFTQSTGPNWVAIGNENGLFPLGARQDLVIVDGEAPEEKLSRALFANSQNLFVLVGKTTGKSKCSEQNTEEFRVFKAEDWYIVSPIDRGMSLRIFASEEYLSVFDYIF